MSQDEERLTLGQASCLVLGLIPNLENRQKAKEIIKETKGFEVSYKRRSDPFEPIIIGKRLKLVNPFLYKSYTVTPPTSPRLDDDHISIDSKDSWYLSSEEEEKVSIIRATKPNGRTVKQEEGPSQSKESANAEYIDKEIIIKYLKSILYTSVEPNGVHKYTYMWVDEKTQLKMVKSHFYVESLTSEKLESWVNESGHFGNRFTRKVKSKDPKLGRFLYLLKQKYRAED